nr:hypothetical protein Q903MT_gene6271 [Picea sitchensis]
MLAVNKSKRHICNSSFVAPSGGQDLLSTSIYSFNRPVRCPASVNVRSDPSNKAPGLLHFLSLTWRPSQRLSLRLNPSTSLPPM